MSDGEATPHGGIDTDPEAETRAAATDGEIHDAMPLVTANRDAPEGIAPANLNGVPRPDGPADPDAPPPDPLTANGLKAIEQIAEQSGLDPLPPNRYLDREESWLRFNQRVLELAEDDTVPLLERVRFLAIFASNLDEFFMVRVAGLMRRMAAGLPVEGVSAQLPGQVLNRTLELAGQLTARHAACFSEQVSPALNAQDIEILRWKELSHEERDNLRELFRERIYPVLTPLVVDPAHPFPFISGLSLNLAVMVADPRTGATMFARVKVPPLLPRFLAVSPQRFVPIEDVIAAHLTQLFAGMDIVEHHVFRVTRVRDLEVDEDVTEDLLQALERELLRRRFDPAVRLEVEDSMSSDVLDRLVTELSVDRRAVYRVPGPLDLSGLSAIADLDIGELRYPPFVPSSSVIPKDTDIFTALRERDVLVHHPYDSFTTSVERLIDEAAADPSVLAIKQTLYRTSGDSPIVDALIDAAELGKQVVVVVEIKARGDERNNIAWARKLEEAGCHVVYGFVGLKTHCKVLLIVREEADGSLRRYCHLGTGNYNPSTARLYEDFGLLTADPTVAEDATDLFNHLTGYARQDSYRQLLVAPESLRAGLVGRIAHQAERKLAGKPARIQFKCNAVIDEVIVDALYRASQAGVPIDLWVRGISAIRPGVPGLSETIRVRSALGRFLEHSRVYAFGTGEPGEDGAENDPDAEGEVWLGSPDMMHRNLDRRVETIVRVSDEGHCRELRRLLNLGMDDGTATWWLDGDGTWTRHNLGPDGQRLRDIQFELIKVRRPRAADA
jgi:polyphosphate kinase